MVLSCICAWFAHLKIQPTKLVFVLSDIFLAYGFSFLVASMGLQMIWSLGLACLDVYAIRRRSDLQSPILLSLFAVGDWVLILSS